MHIMHELLVYFFTIGKFICRSEKQLEKPKFESEPFDIDAYEGTTIELPCSGMGNPKPEASLFFFF